MRLTANVLLGIAPLIMLMIASRTENFWELIIHNSTANNLATIGVVVISGSFFILRRMSSFKP